MQLTRSVGILYSDDSSAALALEIAKILSA